MLNLMNELSTLLRSAVLHYQSYKNSAWVFDVQFSCFCLWIVIFFMYSLSVTFFLMIHIFLFFNCYSKFPSSLKHPWCFPVSDYILLLRWTFIHDLCSSFVVNFVFSFPHPGPPFLDYKISKIISFIFLEILKMLSRVGLCFFLLCFTQRMECKYFPSREVLGREMSFSVANDLYSGFNSPSKSIK